MEQDDDMELSNDTGQAIDTGPNLPDDTERTADTGETGSVEQIYDSEWADSQWYNNTGLPPSEGDPNYGEELLDGAVDDSGQVGNTGQSSNTGQASNIGLTENEILESVVNDVIAHLKPTDTPEQAAKELTKMMEDLISLENNLRAKEDKISNPKKPRPFQIAMLMLAMYFIRRVSCAGPNGNRKYDLLVIYMEDGPDAGTYVEDEEEFYRVALRFNPQMTDREFKEVSKRLRAKAKRVTRTMDPDLIAVNNGVFNFKTKELLPFTPNLVFLTKSHVNYNQNAINVVIHNNDDGTDWDVESWIESLSDDPEIVELLWELLSAIIRPYVSWNKSIWFYSDVGNNGKGTFCVLLRNLCGEEVVATIPISDFSVKFALEVLVKAMAIVTDENDVGTYIDKVANLKAIITGDAVSIDRKFLMPISFQFRGLMVQCVNEMPRIKDKSGSFYRRLLIVPFDKCFTGKEREYIKGDYLRRPEVLEYVLYRALNMDFYKLSNPGACKILLDEYAEFNDPVREFFQEFFLDREEAEEEKEDFAWDLLPFGFLYDLYLAWFAKNNPHGIPQSKKTFTDDIFNASKQSKIWSCDDKRKTVRSKDRMDKPEPLIVQYDLRDWMNPDYTGSNPEWEGALYGHCYEYRISKSLSKTGYIGYKDVFLLLKPVQVNDFRCTQLPFPAYYTKICKRLEKSTGIRKTRFRYSRTLRSSMVLLPILAIGTGGYARPIRLLPASPCVTPPNLLGCTRVPQPTMRFTPCTRAPRAARMIITGTAGSSRGSRAMAAIPRNTVLRMGARYSAMWKAARNR